MNFEPQFFDIFGFIGFVYITILALLNLLGKKVSKTGYIILLCIGVLGIVVDGLIVYFTYLS